MKSLWVKSMWGKSLWVKNNWGKIGVDGMLAFVPPFSGLYKYLHLYNILAPSYANSENLPIS